MLISFVSVVPFIIYAEVKRKMKHVFLFCVALLLVAEIVLWGQAAISGSWSPAFSCSSSPSTCWKPASLFNQ